MKLFRKRHIVHEQRMMLLALAAGLPAVITVMIIIWVGDSYTPKVQWTLSVLIIGCWLGFAAHVKESVANPLRTLANLLEAMREGDYSIRGREDRNEDALREVMQQVNAMSATLRTQRLGAMEATTLLRKVMEVIEVAIFTFDEHHQLRLVNPAGATLLDQPMERLIGLDAEALGLDAFLTGPAQQTAARQFPAGMRRWGVSRTTFREGGLPHSLLVVADLTRPLREEELTAWRRLVRVLGHELNNSLAPIKSIAGSLETLLRRDPLPDDWRDDMRSGLNVIASRSESLSRFMSAYARMAKLPPPTLVPLRVGDLLRRVTGLEMRVRPTLLPGPDCTIMGDGDQLEQALINLIRNAVDASLETGGGVQVGWSRENSHLEVWIRDEGPGLANTGNLFVPFFTTKPGGSGIGLVLSRQIAEAHGGTLALENVAGGHGCEARLTLPL
jgi:two-component system, NtrC family, nitrogen regulation sensor histidine kinase NtrY